jgi:membrane protein DedA with SNARE-associated domain
MFDVESWIDWVSTMPISPIYIYIIIFAILILCGFGLPVPEDITLIAGGVLCGLGVTDFKTMMIVCLSGVIVGDSCVFLVGYYKGEKVLQAKRIKAILTPARFKKVRDKFEAHGDWVLFVARFLPGLRMPIFLTAGTTRRITLKKFLLADGSAAVLSVPTIITVSYLFTDKIDEAIHWIKRGQLATMIIIVFALMTVYVLYRIRHYIKKGKPE